MRPPTTLEERAISVEWQTLLDDRGRRTHDACACLGRLTMAGRELNLRNAGKLYTAHVRPDHLQLPIEEFSRVVLLPAIKAMEMAG